MSLLKLLSYVYLNELTLVIRNVIRKVPTGDVSNIKKYYFFFSENNV